MATGNFFFRHLFFYSPTDFDKLTVLGEDPFNSPQEELPSKTLKWHKNDRLFGPIQTFPEED